jgi:hypothetical protein
MTKRRWTILLGAILISGGALWLLLGREPIQEGRCRLVRKKADSDSQLIGLAVQFIYPLEAKPDRVQGVPATFEQPRYYEIKSGNKPVLMVADFSQKLVRLCVDTDGDGILSKGRYFTAEVSEATPVSASRQRLGPISLISRDSAGKTNDGFYVDCFREDARGLLILRPAFVCTGRVRLDGQTYRVAVMDGDSDGLFNSTLSLPLDHQWRMPACDVFAIDLNRNGTLEISMHGQSEVMPLGKLVKVGDAYYAIEVASDGRSLALSRAEPQFGTLTVEPNDATIELRLWSDAADQYLLQSREQQLPAGKYKAIHAVLVKTDASGDMWTFVSNSSSAVTCLGPLEFFTIEPGETTTIRIGPPFVLKADVQKGSSGRVPISPMIVGCAGEEYAAAYRRSRRQPTPIAFTIVDEKGTVLEAGKFEYG